MYVKNRMTTTVTTVTPEASISSAFQAMVEKGHSHVPVVEGNKLVGLITEKLLTEVSPSKATSLSMYELNYLLSKTKVKDIMKKAVYTATPDMLIEEAAVLMRTKDIGCLPVVINGNELIGIVTRIDIFDAFIELMGFNDSGTRIALEVKDELGTLADISAIVKQYGMNITHIGNFNHESSSQSEIILRLNTLDVDDLLESLQSHGYNVLSVIRKQ